MRHRQRPIGDFGRKADERHGLTGYTSHGCRCAICCAAKSLYQKQRYVAKGSALKAAPKAEPQTLQSWWTGLSREQLTATARIEQARMSASRITGRVSVPDGWR